MYVRSGRMQVRVLDSFCYLTKIGSSLGGAIEFAYVLYPESLHELGPNLRSEAVAAHDPHPMLLLFLGLRLRQQVPANFSNILANLQQNFNSYWHRVSGCPRVGLFNSCRFSLLLIRPRQFHSYFNRCKVFSTLGLWDRNYYNDLPSLHENVSAQP